MRSDDFIEQAVLDGKFRPLPGHLLCLKNTKNQVVEVDGFGSIAASEITTSGLVVVSKDGKVAENTKALLVTVVALGESPSKWETRWFKDKKLKDWRTSWEGQKIQEGTILAIRAISGVDQERGSQFVDLKYNEISMIGQPATELDVPDMLPAPGWVLVEVESVKAERKLAVYDGLEQILQNGNMTLGVVKALPRDYPYDDLAVGDKIAFPTHTGVGATEFIEFDGNLRALPIDNVLGVIE